MPVSSKFRPLSGVFPLLALLGVYAACSSSDSSDDAAGSVGGKSGVVIGTSGVGSITGGPLGPVSPSGGPVDCSGLSFQGCAGTDYEGEAVPLDIYVMFDQSGSMLNDVGGMTRLEAVQRATAEFLRAPESAAIGVGIGYFGDLPIGQASCSADSYEAADVEVTTDHERVIDSLNAREPTGETPTGAALRGACSYASAWKRSNPGRAVVILLVTDGVPEAPVTCANATCCPTLDDAVAAAAECSSANPGVATYVLGVGPALGNLASIARAGKTGDAYLVEDRSAATEVLHALNTIRGALLVPCELEIPAPPSGRKLDYQQVNLAYSQSDCFEPFYYVESASQCGADGGWFYDDPSAPNTVKLCPSSCDLVSAPGASLRFSLGCQTALAPVH